MFHYPKGIVSNYCYNNSLYPFYVYSNDTVWDKAVATE